MKRICTLLVCTVFLASCGGRTVNELSPADVSAIRNADEVAAVDGDWPWWRGPTMNAHAAGETPPVSWSETENVVWKVDLPGLGHSSPTVAGDRIFVTTADESAETMSLICLNRADGKPLWDKQIHEGGFMHTHGDNSHASPTPACDAERVFVVFMVQNAIWATAVDLDGDIVWQERVEDFSSRHGYGSSPVLYKSLLIVAGDNHGSGFLAALDRETGKKVWQVPRKNSASFCTPIIAELDGRSQLLMSGQDRVIGYDPASGQELWRADGTTGSTANTMAWTGKLVIAGSGYPDSRVEAFRADNGRRVWEKNFKLYVPSPLVVGDRLFFVTDNGVAYCLVAGTGKQVWKKRLDGGFYASPVLAGDTIFVPNRSGTVYVFKAGDKYELVAKNQLSGDMNASPVICGGRMYLRTSSRLYCIGHAAPE